MCRLAAARYRGLDAGSSSAVATTLTIPGTTPGARSYLIAKADDVRAVNESTETNNTKYLTIYVGPDMTVSSLTGPSTGAPGGTISMTVETKNNGAGTAAATVTRLYLSTDYYFNAGDILLGAIDVPELGTGVANRVVQGFRLPMEQPPGFYYLIAVSDATGVVPESSEINNTRSRSFNIY